MTDSNRCIAFLDRHGRRGHLRSCWITPSCAGASSDGGFVLVDPTGPPVVSIGSAVDPAVDAASAGTGVSQLFEDWLRPLLDSGALEPVLQP